MESIVIFVLLMVLFTVWITSVRRSLVIMNEHINHAMNQIGVQISARFDALAALLDIAKSYAEDESAALISEIKARRSVITAKSKPDDVIRQEELIYETLGKIVRMAQHCPALKEDEDYVSCMDAIDCYEGMIFTSRLIYNDSVTKYNRVILLFPNSLAVKVLGFHKRDNLESFEDGQRHI